MFFNPTDETIRDIIDLPIYYTGLSKTARLTRENDKTELLNLERDYTIPVRLGKKELKIIARINFAIPILVSDMGPRNITWVIIS